VPIKVFVLIVRQDYIGKNSVVTTAL